MSRAVSNDFKELKEFVENYSIRALSGESDYIILLSKQHKKLHSYLTFTAELDFQKTGFERNKSISQMQLDYLTESCSDIGNAMFLNVQGAYKASRMMLRSSIETFHKGFNLDELPKIVTIKSVFEIFEIVNALKFFKDQPLNLIGNNIHSQYKELCKDIHTAKLENMQKTIGLGYFPSYSKTEASLCTNILLDLVTSYLICLSFKYRDYLFCMHHRNKEIIIENLPKKIRSKLFSE